MKKILFAIGILFTLAITSCKDDFNVAAPYKQITVAYAVFNRDDTAHYIRIQKAFLDESKSAITMAQNPDSSYYKENDITVVVREYSVNGNSEQLLRTLNLTRVDLNKEGYIKEPAGNQGFFTSPNYAYKLKFPAGQTFEAVTTAGVKYKYRVVITNHINGEVDSSDLVGIVNSRGDKGNADNFYIPSFTNANYSIRFASTTNQSKYTLTGTTPLNGKWLEGIMRFRVVSKNTATNSSTSDTLYFTFDSKADEAGTQFDLNVLNSSIYTFLKGELGAAPANTFRYLDSCDIFVYCGSNELYTFQQVNTGQTGGILGDQIKPIYSNLRGENVFGMIGSRAYKVYPSVPIDKVTLDSLKAHPITRDIGFKDVTED